MPLISIIVPVYKVESYLHECVGSIIRQTLRDIEVILVDDGSPDNCPAICDDYAKKDARIKVIHKKNGGLSSARNAGLEVAQGDYFCFVDSDDVLHPQYCEILFNGIVNSSCSFCACKSTTFKSDDALPTMNTSKYNDISYSTLEWINYIKSSQMGVWNKIYNRSIFDNICFYNGKIHEDIVFCADLSNIVTSEIIITDCTLYYARLRENSICDTIFLKTDRVFAARYFIENTKNFPEVNDYAFFHAIGHPWNVVDYIYVKFKIKENYPFLKEFKLLIHDYLDDFLKLNQISDIQKRRMKLFSKSLILYGLNAYGRLLRVYIYKLFRKNPYENGHGI